MTDDLPYRVEYSKSGRAGCKVCKETIAKDELRIATVVQVCVLVKYGCVDEPGFEALACCNLFGVVILLHGTRAVRISVYKQ